MILIILVDDKELISIGKMITNSHWTQAKSWYLKTTI